MRVKGAKQNYLDRKEDVAGSRLLNIEILIKAE